MPRARSQNLYSQQLAQKLEQERQVNLSADRIRRILKKRALVGSGLDTRNGADKILSTKHSKQADLDTLQLAACEGYIDLKYLDESGCCLESPVSYSYSRIGEQKHRRAGQILWRPH
ncbi:MAG: hypothetical protein N4J56_004294 [Chroococcidiopsis sp. SAG 2025]|nr:hypothetical protein [Chroococcidiopsis sp. SAG 2025]MDV2994640.1 hypothetical protein [Chroococcidiopsis sp. SAG 2025]